MKQFYKDLPVLVTGGCGFIGSHLCAKLVELGARVTIIDNLSTGSLKNIESIANQVTLITKSITDYQACVEATQNQSLVFHLAAFISVPESIEKPRSCYATNVDGTANLLEAAKENHVSRFIFSSSAAIYGLREGICREDMAPAPLSPYGYSKLIGELYCQQYAQNYGFQTVCMRYFNVYGPRQNPNGQYAAAVAKFTHQMKNNLPITIFGDGKQTRDFVPVNTVVQANLVLGMAPTESVVGQVFNVGSGHSINLLELIAQLKETFPAYSGEITFAPARIGDVKYSAADCSKFIQITV
jgi:UDP-glucose 4-epimerase